MCVAAGRGLVYATHSSLCSRHVMGRHQLTSRIPSMTIWTQEFETGHPQIDAEHREFIRQLNEIRAAIDAGAGRELIVRLIILLQNYALAHFAREEAHMHRVGCPTHRKNCEAHGEFSEKLAGWLVLLSYSGTSVTLMAEVHRESLAWIESHIKTVDCGLRRCPRDPKPPGA